MFDTLQIAVPSRSRPSNLKTLNNVSANLAPNLMVVVPRNQYDDYRWALPQSIMVVPFDGEGIAAKREFILNMKPNGKVIMLDDDLSFYIRVQDGSNFRRATPGETEHMIADIVDFLDVYPFVGITDKLWSQTRPRKYMECTRFNQVLGVNRDLLPKPWPHFDLVKHDEEHCFHLQLLTRGVKTLVLTEWSKSETPNSKGGCSDWRTPETYAETHQTLSQLFPEIVTILPATKAELERGKTTRVNYKWKEAMRQGGLLS